MVNSYELPPLPTGSTVWTLATDLRGCRRLPAPIRGRIRRFKASGISITVPRIVSGAALFYARETSMAPDAPAAMHQAWTNLCVTNPRVEAAGGVPRLVIDFVGSNLQRALTEVYGVSVGLAAASMIYGVPLQRWGSLGHERLDYECQAGPHQRIRVEVRGRKNGGGWKRARDEAREKLRATSNVDLKGALLVAVCDTADFGKPNLFFMDPEGSRYGNYGRFEAERLILDHYTDVAWAQGHRRTALLLSQYAGASDSVLEKYLMTGNPDIFTSPSATFDLGGRELLGTYFTDIALPESLSPDGAAVIGTVFDGVTSTVATQLRKGEVLDIEPNAEDEGTHGRRRFVLGSDGRAVVFLRPKRGDSTSDQGDVP